MKKFSYHRRKALESGLSKTEAFANAVAFRLLDCKNNIWVRTVFAALKRFANFWHSACVKIEKRRKNSKIIKRYLERCDSLMKKVGFVFSVIYQPLRVVTGAVVVAITASMIMGAASYDVVLGVYTDGAFVGYLDSKSPMTVAQSLLESDISGLTGSDYKMNTKIDYSFLNVKKPTLLNSADCYRILYDIASVDFADAYALYVDGNFVAACDSYEKLSIIVKNIGENSDGSLKNDIEIASQLCLRSTIRSPEDIAILLNSELRHETTLMLLKLDDSEDAASQNNSTRVEAHTSAASKHDDGHTKIDVGIVHFSDGISSMTTPRTLADGTKITADIDELRQELNLTYVKSEIVTEAIPYETAFEQSDDYYIGVQMLKTAGRNGSARVVYDVEYNNDGELSRTEVSRNVIKEPITEVLVVGTSEIPTKNPSGNFIWPTSSTKPISSDYGGRQLFGAYDFHLGVDILNSYGGDIWASDSGTVTYAGFNGSYGYYVVIEHADGFSTLYAHMSKIYTEKGAQVKQGDVIGAIGKTGVATAYHVHFELRVDGKTVDPEDYLPAFEVTK